MARRGTDRSKRYENVEFLGEGQVWALCEVF